MSAAKSKFVKLFECAIEEYIRVKKRGTNIASIQLDFDDSWGKSPPKLGFWTAVKLTGCQSVLLKVSDLEQQCNEKS